MRMTRVTQVAPMRVLDYMDDVAVVRNIES